MHILTHSWESAARRKDINLSRYSGRQSGARVGAQLQMWYRARMLSTGFSADDVKMIPGVAAVHLCNSENKN